jgi:hypothetical protein
VASRVAAIRTQIGAVSATKMKAANATMKKPSPSAQGGLGREKGPPRRNVATEGWDCKGVGVSRGLGGVALEVLQCREQSSGR